MQIIVVGAGLAGLVAADELCRAGHAVVVLEARDRVGGRILTIRDGLADRQYADAGAEIVYGGQPFIPELCARLGITLTDVFAIGNRARRLVFGGALLEEDTRAAAVSALTSAFVNCPSAPHETAAAWGRRARLPEAAICLVRALAQSSPGASPRTVDPSEVEKNLTHGSGFRKIQGGSDRLPKAIARTLDVRLSAPARRIVWSANGVTVHTGNDVHQADRCVVAVPGPVTLELGFDPPLPPEKVKAHLALGYGTASRIVVQYAEGTMLRETMGSGIFTEAMPASLHDQSMHLPGTAIVLSGIAGGDDEPTMQSEADALARIDHVVATAAGRPATRLFGSIISWTRDPWSRAVVRAPIGDQRMTVIPRLAAPLGDRLFFAGEHTDGRPGPGGMEGAAKSGLRAAREIMERAAV